VPATITLTPGANSIITNVNVDFGDGSSSGDLGPIVAATTLQHAFRSPGQKTVAARATDGEGNVSTSSTVAVVAPLTLTLTVPTTGLTRNALLTFTATPSTGALIERYVWDFGDGSPQTTQSNQILRAFPTGGYHVITVTATPIGGGSTATAQATVFISN
jgi:PKD repeat protein